ncbi:hypothetical protein [Bradyrhizobium sp. LM6.9]
MTRFRQRSDQTEEIARKLEIVLAELASLRILLAAHGISTPPPLHEDYLTVQRFAAMNHISSEGVLSRIPSRQVARGEARWPLVGEMHGLHSIAVQWRGQ